MTSRIAKTLPKLSQWAFFLTIVLIPFRLRTVLITRPVVPLWEDYTDILLFASDVTLLLTLGLWLADHLVNKTQIKTGPRFMTLPMIGLTLVAFVTSFTSIDTVYSFYQTIRLVLLFGFYLYVLNKVKSLDQLVLPISIMVAIQSVIAITQALTQHSVGLQWLGEYELDPAWSGVSIVWTETMRSLRAYGLSAHPNILGGILAFAILLILVWYHNHQKSLDVYPFAILAIGVIAVFLTFSRSSWLGAFVGILFVTCQGYVRPKTKLTWGNVLPLIALIFLLLPFIWANQELVGIRLNERISFEEIEPELGSMGERRVLTSAANDLFSENTILGVGIGASPRAFLVAFPDFPVNYAPPHNVILVAALETGLLGGLLYLILLLAPWVSMYVNRKFVFSIELLASSAVLLAVGTVGFFDCYPWCSWSGQLWQHFAWGLWGSFYLQSIATKKK